MAFTTPAGISVVKQQDLLLPAISQFPLRKALQNLNYLYTYHSPPMLSVAYCSDAASTRAAIYHLPCMPSADGLRYVFEHRIVCSAAAQNITITVEYCVAYAGGATVWAAAYTQAIVTGGAGALTTSVSAATTLPANAVALRVQYSAPAVGTRTDHHLLVYASTNTVLAGVKSSGFIPFDTGALSSAEKFAIHEEYLNRCKTSSAAVMKDRKQCAFAFVQEYTAAPHFICSDAIYGSLGYPLPLSRAWLPHAKSGVTIDVKAIGVVSGGTTAGLITLGQKGQQKVSLAADGALNSATLTLYPEGTNGDAYADLALRVRNTSGNQLRVFAVVAFWTPDADNAAITSWANPAPTALASMLAKACKAPEKVALQPYVGTAHVFDGATVGLKTRYLAARIAPGAEAANCGVTQTGDYLTVAPAAPTNDITASSMLGKTASFTWTGNPTEQALVTPSFGLASPFSALLETTTSEDYGVLGFVTGETALQLTTQNTPYTEALSVTNATGFSLHICRQIADFETL